MPSLRTANCFAPYKSTEKIHKSPQSNSLRNAHIPEQQQKGFDFCSQYHQTSTLGRPSFPYCNRIPQLCYLRSRVQGLQVLNQSGYQPALILLTTLPLGDTKACEMKDKGDGRGISRGGGQRRDYVLCLCLLGKIISTQHTLPASLVLQKPGRNWKAPALNVGAIYYVDTKKLIRNQAVRHVCSFI